MMRFNTFLTPYQINACARILYYNNKFLYIAYPNKTFYYVSLKEIFPQIIIDNARKVTNCCNNMFIHNLKKKLIL